MKISKEDVGSLLAQIGEACPALAKLGGDALMTITGIVIEETTKTIDSIEKRIAEAGSIPTDVLLALMHNGAFVTILMDLPPDSERRTIVEAGQEIGKFVAKKFGERIADKLTTGTKH